MASLVDHWLEGLDVIPIADEASVSEVRGRLRSLGAADDTFTESCAIIASELGHNQLRHAREGSIGVRSIERDGIMGLEIIAADRGPGIPSEVFHRTDRPVSGSLGAGLAAVQRLSDEVDFDVRAQEGTCVRARKFSANVSHRREIAIAGRPAPGENISGDHAIFSRSADRLIACVLDGVGHGQPARDAADRAAEVAAPHLELEASDLLRVLEERLRGGRGSVFSRVVFDERNMIMAHVGVGNAKTILLGPVGSQTFVTINGIVGQPISRRGRLAEVAEVQPGQLIVMHTDGLTSRVGLGERPDLFYRPPIAIATYLLETFARAHDDALVLVIR